jgi:hypothetical protein
MRLQPGKEELDTLPSFGKDGWIKYRFNRGYTNVFPKSDFDVYLDPKTTTEIVSVEVAGNRVAQEIYDVYKNIYVAMSGGIDSEWVATCFQRQGIPFTPIIYEAEDLQHTDTYWAVKWCEKNNLTPVIYKDSVPEFSKRIVSIASKFCTRQSGGPAILRPLSEFVEQRGGYLVTGAGFPEYWPDPNLGYLKYKVQDVKLFDSQGNTIVDPGWIIHENDIMHAMYSCKGHPFNFLSWNPEILLSYIHARDSTKNSEYNKSNIFKCTERPKQNGTNLYFWRNDPLVSQLNKFAYRVGTSQVEYLGTTEELIKFLTVEVCND